jgi:LuxR family transcriptional regulator, quorum-sensing system regulator BjaR1
MTLAEQTLEFAAQAPEMHTRKSLGAGLLNVFGAVGASHYACLYLRREGGELTIDKSISNLPRAWLELYLARGYDAIDPVFQGVVRGGSYGYWNELTRGMVLDRESREVMGEARKFDMKDGFTKRVTLDSGGVAVVMAAGLELEKQPMARAALRLACDVFANEGARMLRTSVGDVRRGGGPALSRTQLKVLMMRSEGLSNKMVAQKMGRHEKTVECHVTEILRRLDARNMIDAIRIATALKLIL